MIKICCLVLLLGMCWPHQLSAQNRQLSVYKPNGSLAKRYYEGDVIWLQWKQDHWLRGEIDRLFTDSLVVEGFSLALSDITAVRVMNGLKLGPAANLAVAGIVYPGIVIINGLTSDSRPLLTTRAAWSSALLLAAAGSLTYAGGLRTYKTRTDGRLRITDFDFSPIPEQVP